MVGQSVGFLHITKSDIEKIFDFIRVLKMFRFNFTKWFAAIILLHIREKLLDFFEEYYVTSHYYAVEIKFTDLLLTID